MQYISQINVDLAYTILKGLQRICHRDFSAFSPLTVQFQAFRPLVRALNIS